MKAKLNKNIGISNEGNLSMTYFAFMYVCDQMINHGSKIEDFKFEDEDGMRVSEIGFKEFLSRIAWLQYEGLSPAEHTVRNEIISYIQTPEKGKEGTVTAQEEVGDLDVEIAEALDYKKVEN